MAQRNVISYFNPSVDDDDNLNTNNESIEQEQIQETELESELRTKYPLHYAAYKGQVEQLKKLCFKHRHDIKRQDSEGKTPLHYACNIENLDNALQIVSNVLSSGVVSSDIIDDYGYKAIDYARQRGHLQIIQMLAKVKQEQDIVDKYSRTYYRSTALYYGIQSGDLEVTNGLFSNGERLLHEAKNADDEEIAKTVTNLLNHVPTECITELYDDSISVSSDVEDGYTYDDVDLALDFRPVVGYLGVKDSSLREMETKWVHNAVNLPKERKKTLLLHPIVNAFMYLKWKKFRYFLWLSISYHVLWMLLFTLFVTHLYIMNCPYENFPVDGESDADGTAKNTNLTRQTRAGSGPHEIMCDGKHSVYLQAEIGVVLAITVTIVIKELYELYSGFKIYILQWENIGQWILVGVIIYTGIPVYMTDSDDHITIRRWQYQAAAYGIFLAWVLILTQIGKYPLLAVYVEMLGRVLRSFILFMISFVSLFVAFMLAYIILLPAKDEFYDFPWSIIKILTMMTGEINYDDTFYGDKTDYEVPFFLSTKLITAAFVAVVTIGLFNLLIGLTVSDIQKLESEAKLSSLLTQLEEIYLMEGFLLSERVQRFMESIGASRVIESLLVLPPPVHAAMNNGVSTSTAEAINLNLSTKSTGIPIIVPDGQIVKKNITHFPAGLREELRTLLNNKESSNDTSELDEKVMEYLKSFLNMQKGTLRLKKMQQ